MMGLRLWKLVGASSQPALRAIPLRGDLSRGGSELLAGVLVSVEDIRLDAAIPSLPGSEIDVHFSARLGFTRRAEEVHDEFMRPSAFGHAASLPQELLQVEDLVGIADIDVHAAGRSGVAATESPLSLSSETPVCQEVLSPPSFRKRSDFGSGQSSSPWPTRRLPSKSLKVQPGDRGS